MNDPFAWVADAACNGRDDIDWYPSRGAATAPAKAVCADCPVRIDCLHYALNNNEHFGIWGGTSERERRRIRRRHGALSGPKVVHLPVRSVVG